MGFDFNDMPLAAYGDDSACAPGMPYPDVLHCQVSITPDNVLAVAKALVRPVTYDGKSLADLGYRTLQFDYGWNGPRNGPVDRVTGQKTLTPNPQRWGSLHNFLRVVHKVTRDIVSPKYDKHLQLGIYEGWGTGTECQDDPAWAYWDTDNGLYQHEVTDARTFARWGVSKIRMDSACGNGLQGYGNPPDGFEGEMKRVDNAFAKWAPNIALDINNSLGPNWPCKPRCDTTPDIDTALLGADSYDVPAPQYTNVWSLGLDDCGCFDYQPNYSTGVLEGLDIAVADHAADLVKPGSWASLSELLPSGAEGIGWTESGYGCCGVFPGSGYKNWLTPREQQTQFGLYALLATPLTMSSWIPRVQQDPAAMKVLTNQDVIAVDQDRRGDMARIVDGPIVPPKRTIQSPGPPTGTYQVFSKVLSGSGKRAVGLLNRTDAPMDITARFDELRCDSGAPGGLDRVRQVRDLWTHRTVPADRWVYSGAYTETVPAHGLALLEVQGTSSC